MHFIHAKDAGVQAGCTAPFGDDLVSVAVVKNRESGFNESFERWRGGPVPAPSAAPVKAMKRTSTRLRARPPLPLAGARRRSFVNSTKSPKIAVAKTKRNWILAIARWARFSNGEPTKMQLSGDDMTSAERLLIYSGGVSSVSERRWLVVLDVSRRELLRDIEQLSVNVAEKRARNRARMSSVSRESASARIKAGLPREASETKADEDGTDRSGSGLAPVQTCQAAGIRGGSASARGDKTGSDAAMVRIETARSSASCYSSGVQARWSLVMRYVDIPTTADLKSLISRRDDICMSLYLRTSPVTQETAGDRIELKNLAKQGIHQLEEAGRDKRRVAALAEQLDDLIDDDEFWRFQARSLAVLATPDNIRTFRLPNALEPAVEVSDRFFVKPLLRAVTFPHTCYVLAPRKERSASSR